eukprot:TRINITY_DN74518_c0_g1_i1.p1 TRINITY_DN74518_c0_g1~~TRINITY_DN74518_c0_g1_i1.p1  ORF type:complete len:307 (+),score=54.85 TRINITY_DN74518_c0_g1_i1:297-1217(+)
MDCSIVASQKYLDLFIVSTVDFFYPLVEDPYLQGQIAACNVLSDMYSMGIDTIDNVLMTLAASTAMPPNVRRIATEQMMLGFGATCKEAGTCVTGGQTILNPWPIIGGVAKSVLKEGDFIRPENAIAGDVLVLTKPLGTQLAVNMREWLHEPTKRQLLLQVATEEEVNRAFSIAQASMGRLNKDAARLMRKYKAHAGTDVTGFGILGHVDNLAQNQKTKVQFVIDKLPCIAGTMKVADKHPVFKLREGYSAETSGGLLFALPADQADAYCKEIEEVEGWPAWVIGRVEEGAERKAVLSPNVEVLEV